VRFDDRPNDTDGRVHKYAGSLNIDFDFRSSKLGETMMEQTILKEAETVILDAVCDADKHLTEKYIELGFVGTRYWLDNEVPTLDIVFDQENNMRLKTRGLSQEQIIRSVNNGSVSPSYRLLATTERPDFSTELREGEILTRYFSHTDALSRQMKYYAVFERVSS
jgi:hypothetical protein